jgi:hypothetical protein
MKLYRLESDNEKYDYKMLNDNKNIFDEYEKMKIIQNLSHNWNEKLKIDFKVPKSLYNYSLTDLKLLEKKYLSDDLEMITENIKTIEHEPLIENDDILNESVQVVENLEKINRCLSELQEKYLSSEAVNNIRIENDEIVFDVLCETEIQSVDEYDGIKLRFNRMCELHENNIDIISDIKMFIEDKMIEDCGKYNYSWLVKEFTQFITKGTSLLLTEYENIYENVVIDKIIKEEYPLIYDAATTSISQDHNLDQFKVAENIDNEEQILKEYYKYNMDYVKFINEMKQYKNDTEI